MVSTTNCEDLVVPPPERRISRRHVLASAAACAVLPPLAVTPSLAVARFFDPAMLERIADRDAQAMAPLVIDAQTHVWWREGGLRRMTANGEHFLKALAGARASVIGKPVPIAD